VTPLSHADVRRLKLVLECGSELEKIWSALLPSPSDLNGVRVREHALERLTSAIHALEQADSENLRRLSFHTRNLTLDMTSRHLTTVIVPFERLLGKALRDDEILIDEGDKSTALGTLAPMRVIADNLRSAFNVGALLRTAECFGVENVSLAGYTPTPDSDKTARTSLGTEKSVSWSSDPNVHDVIARAKEDGYEVIALETAREAVLLNEFSWPAKCALLLGNERFGLDRDVLDLADHVVKIPMHGTKNSLNVGIACGIALAEWRKSVDVADAKPPRELAPATEVKYQPLAVFHSSAKHPYDAPRQGSIDDSGLLGTITLPASHRDSLKDLASFDRVWLIYDFHQNKSWKTLVMPPRGAREKRGVFATRSPYRPNSIGLSCVELVKLDGTTLTVRSTDLLDGTPILDIKPYVAYADSFPDAKMGWLRNIEAEKFNVDFTNEAEAQLAWLAQNGLTNLRSTLVHQLEYNPLDSNQKRVKRKEPGYEFSYRTWRAHFLITGQTVSIDAISSGYSPDDLDSLDDRYRDKALHRAFVARL
jgi:tRNA-Thr(GGU) m(6)t(6)A37 methyltransferase TsaA